MKPPHRTLWCSAALLVAGAAHPQDDGIPDRSALEARFEKLMSGCTMEGRFTIDGSDGPPREERYTIARVAKVEDHRWRFEAEIAYAGKSVTIPIVVGVRWAGDTPMIQVTDLNVPMLGTYTARVLVYGERYAGTWSGRDHGGHMFGRIVRGRAERRTGAWTRWRGPAGDGVAPDADPPVEWSEEKNVRWKLDVPGLGSSTPIVWRDRLYLTTAIETEKVAEPAADPPADEPAAEPRRPAGRGRGRFGRGRFGRFRRAAPTTIHEFVVLAVDRASGEIAWRKQVAAEVPHEAGHRTGTHASNSPVTDGERLYAYFGSRGLHCLDLDGELLWSEDLGRMRTRNQFGEGSSPALFGDTLVVNWDHEGDSFIAAFDKRSGEELWRTPRDEQTSWSTPIIAPVDGRPQVIVAATGASRGYDLETGELVWSCSGMTVNCIPTPIHRDGVAYLMSGFRGASLQAIRLAGAKGDITGSEHVLWSHGRSTSYVPSALLYDGYLYFLRSNSGILSCLDARTGKVHYEGERLRGVRSVYSSPVGAAGRVYVTSREGTTKVIELGPELRELATNRLDDGFDASAVVVGDELYLRGREHLYCIAR